MENLIRLCVGSVYHKRLRPIENKFRYPVWYARIPIVQDLRSNYRFFSINKFNLFSISSADYLDGSSLELNSKLQNFLDKHHLDNFEYSKVVLQTNLKVLGFVFNPVSFWEFRSSDDKLVAVLVEVNNTFGERHYYFLNLQNLAEDEDIQANKIFHVSPFYPVEGFYRFRFLEANDFNKTVINYLGKDQILDLSTSIEGKHLPMSDRLILNLFLKYGWITVMVVFRIHWQALILFYKKVKFYKKPTPPSTEIS